MGNHLLHWLVIGGCDRCCQWLRPMLRLIFVNCGLTAQVAQYAEILKEEVPTVVKILTKQMETPENLLVDGRPMEASLRFQPRPRVFRDAHSCWI